MKKTILLFVSMLSLNTNCRELPSYSELFGLLFSKTTSVNTNCRKLPSYPELLDLLLLKATSMPTFWLNDANRAGLIWNRPVEITHELIKECPERIAQIEREYAMNADSETPSMLHSSIITRLLNIELNNLRWLAGERMIDGIEYNDNGEIVVQAEPSKDLN
jgi:hypothetical protein